MSTIASFAKLTKPLTLRDLALKLCPALASAFPQMMLEIKAADGSLLHPQFATREALRRLQTLPEIRSLWLNNDAQRFEANLMPDSNLSLSWPVPEAPEDTEPESRLAAMSEVHGALVRLCGAEFAYTSRYDEGLYDLHEAVWTQLLRLGCAEALKQQANYFWLLATPERLEPAPEGYTRRALPGCQLLLNADLPSFWPRA